MLTGISASVMSMSVPWSRLKPRRKYWLALPSPLCWVAIKPGTSSSTHARPRLLLDLFAGDNPLGRSIRREECRVGRRRYTHFRQCEGTIATGDRLIADGHALCLHSTREPKRHDQRQTHGRYDFHIKDRFAVSGSGDVFWRHWRNKRGNVRCMSCFWTPTARSRRREPCTALAVIARRHRSMTSSTPIFW